MNNINNLKLGETELLVIAGEEASEVIQAISKVLRHGWSSRYENGDTNFVHLEKEWYQLCTLMRYLGFNYPSSEQMDSIMLEKSKWMHHYQKS